MKLYLIRHGEAMSSIIDQQRSLSTVGQLQVQHLAQHLMQQNAKPIHIYHSGILRAEQTAQILAQNLNVTDVKKITALLPEDAIDIVFQQITAWTQDTMLVGHLPYMAYLLGALCKTAYVIQFDTATAVCLTGAKNKWLVEAVLRP